jgi:drug/metabolite transporter (DMT)-like permease
MYILLYGAFKKAATSSIAVLSFIYPLVAVIVDFVAYGRILSYAQLSGGVLIVMAAAAYSAGINPFSALGRPGR